MSGTPIHILVVEDEALIAMYIADVLVDLGFTPVGPALDIPSALNLIANQRVDAAILDLFVCGALSFAVADELTRQGKPFLFTTGHPEAFPNNRYKDVPILFKPFSTKELDKHLRKWGRSPR